MIQRALLIFVFASGTLRLNHGTGTVKQRVPMGCHSEAYSTDGSVRLVSGWQENTNMLWVYSKDKTIRSAQWKVVCP